MSFSFRTEMRDDRVSECHMLCWSPSSPVLTAVPAHRRGSPSLALHCTAQSCSVLTLKSPPRTHQLTGYSQSVTALTQAASGEISWGFYLDGIGIFLCSVGVPLSTNYTILQQPETYKF